YPSSGQRRYGAARPRPTSALGGAMSSRMSRHGAVLAAAACAALALAVAPASAGPVSFDGVASTAAVTPATILATAPFALGEVDPTTLGVPLTDLAAVGMNGASPGDPGDGQHMWIVDDDHAQCPNADFTSIQAAVDASGPN